MAVVRLVAHVPRRRNGNGSNNFSVVVGIFVKVDDCKKIRGHAGLVARPDIESFGHFAPVVVEFLVGVLAACAEGRPTETYGHQNRSTHHGRGIESVIRLHVRSLLLSSSSLSS